MIIIFSSDLKMLSERSKLNEKKIILFDAVNVMNDRQTQIIVILK